MLLTLQIATTFLVSIGWALALSHALEMPGKLRLNKEAYITAQTIYYPGFTIGAAVGEAAQLSLRWCFSLSWGHPGRNSP